MQGPEAIGANIQLLLATLIHERPFVDVRHKAPRGRVLSVTDVMTVERTRATNIASLCHFK